MHSYNLSGTRPRADVLHNRILAALPPDALESVRRSAPRVRVVHGQVLADAGQSIDHAYFMLSGLVCLVTGEKNGAGPQLAMIGKEAGVGVMEFCLESRTALATAVVQISGAAVRLSFDNLTELIEPGAPFRTACLQAVQDLTRQQMDGAASNASDTVAERCIRWLIMARDRLESDEVMITHDALAALFGVQRSGVTAAISKLHRRGLIQTARGRIILLDVPAMRALGATLLRSSADYDNAAPQTSDGNRPNHPQFSAGPHTSTLIG